MASPTRQPLGTFPFAIRTPDGRHAKVIGHFTPLEWPPSESAFDYSPANDGPSPVFVLTELGNPAVLPAMRLGDDTVEWLDTESSSAPSRSAQSRHSILGSPILAIPDNAAHSGYSRRRSLPRLMRSKSDATLPRNRIRIGHPHPFLPISRNQRASVDGWQHTQRLSHKSSLDVPRKAHSGNSRSMSASPSSLVATFSNWTVKKRNSMRKKSTDDFTYPHPSPSLCAYEDFGVTQYPSKLAPSPFPYYDEAIRAPIRKRASMPAAWMQSVPTEERTASLAPPTSPSRHAFSHSISTEYSNAEAIRRLVAAHNRSAPPVPPASSSATGRKSHFQSRANRTSIRPSYVIKRKPVAVASRSSSDEYPAPTRPPIREPSSATADAYGTTPRIKTLKPRGSRRSLLPQRDRDEPGLDQNVLSYIQTKAMSIFKRKLRKTAAEGQQHYQSAVKQATKPWPIAKKVKSFVSLRHDNNSATSLSSISSDEYDETATTIMHAEAVRLGYTAHTVVRKDRDPSCPIHGTHSRQQSGPPVTAASLQAFPRQGGFPHVSSGSPCSEGSTMLPSSASEEDIGLAISTGEDGDRTSTPSRKATVSRARGKRYYLSCPPVVPDTASSDASTASSSSSTPEGGNSPVSTPYTTPYSTPPKSRRGPPAQPPPAGPLPPIPYPKATTALKSRPAIPKIQVSVTPTPSLHTNPSRERFQSALDRVHDDVWHGSIRETKREHGRDTSMTTTVSMASMASMASISTQGTPVVLRRSSRVALPTSTSVDDELAMTSLLSGWSLAEMESEECVLQDNESGVLDTMDWWDPKVVALQGATASSPV